MPRVRVRVTIDAPPREVWNVVEDIARHVEWMTDAVAIRFVSRQTSGVGTTFECDTRIGPFRLLDHMVVTEWKPAKVLGVAHHGLVAGDGRFTLERARGGRTRFTWTEKLRFPIWFGGRAGAYAAKPFLRRIWRHNLRTLKAQVEGGS